MTGAPRRTRWTLWSGAHWGVAGAALVLLGACSEADRITLASDGAAGSDVVPAPVDSGTRRGPVGPYLMGADVSTVPEQVDQGAEFVDTDGRRKPFLSLLKGHGFNAIRLRTFVDPLAEYGYASSSGGCRLKNEAYNDLPHVVDAARAVKAEEMYLLLNFHYSDTWADPSKQLIPESFRDATTVEELAERVHRYTTEVLTALAEAGATPDMVQVGNEITPGLLIHEPTRDTDCYGNNARERIGATGSMRNVERVATLLAAGIAAVHEVDDSIEIMLHVDHLDRPLGVVDWAQSVLDAGVRFDVLGLSAYPQFQGPVDEWPSAIELIADRLPSLSLSIVEYNPEGRLLNDLLRALPDERGRGSFFWEPTLTGAWGRGLFDWSGNQAVANADDFAVFDAISDELGLR